MGSDDDPGSGDTDSLAAFRPHAPTANPFADTWYYYLNDPAVGYLKVVFLSYVNGQTAPGQGAYVHVAHATPDDFYDQVTPSQTVFGADHPVAKTMNAHLELQILQEGTVVESVTLPQSILEFGGVLYPGA